MRTRKQIEHERRAVGVYLEAGDRLAAFMIGDLFRRDHDRYDVFGNPCKCWLTDEGEWSAKMCPVHEEPR